MGMHKKLMRKYLEEELALYLYNVVIYRQTAAIAVHYRAM
jgi:hypothetical protein